MIWAIRTDSRKSSSIFPSWLATIGDSFTTLQPPLYFRFSQKNRWTKNVAIKKKQKKDKKKESSA